MKHFLILGLLIIPSLSHAKCYNQWKSIHMSYIELYKKLPQNIKADPTLSVSKIVKMPLKACYKKSGLGQYLKAVSDHSKKIGVLLPIGGRTTAYSNETLAGMQRFFKRKNIPFKDYVVLEDTRDIPRQLEAKIAKLIFVDAVAMLVGGQTRKEAKLISKWASKLQIPSIVLVPNNGKSSKQVFNISPNLKLMADTLAKFAKSQKIKSLAIVSTTQRNSLFTELFVAAAKAQGISVEKRANYNAKDYHSLEYATKKLFQIEREKRAEEFKELFDITKEQAQKNGEAFDPDKVYLPPIVDFDAIYFADNFKNLRHFVKILQYLNVPKLPLFGNYMWRAKELIEPYDPYLKNSAFVDYIGSYKSLPYGYQPDVGDDLFFTGANEVSKLDLGIAGYHAMNIAYNAIKSKPKFKRHYYYSLLRSMKNIPGKFFGAKKIFRKSGQCEWPAFLFRVTPVGLNLQSKVNE